MDFERGYRLRLSHLGEWTKLVGAYRTHALRIMATSYAEQIARTAVAALDASSLGLVHNKGDLLARAEDSVKDAHDKVTDGIYAHSLNCWIEFHFVGPAILAVMTHGGDRFRKPWEARREVVRWGWSENGPKPTHIGEKAWKDREVFWREVAKTSAADFGKFRFTLLEDKLPALGWNAIGRCMPTFEWRVEQCVRKLAIADRVDPAAIPEKERKRFEVRVQASIQPEICEASFSTVLTMNRPTERLAPILTRQKEARTSQLSSTEEMASIIDHADIVVAADGRAFLAVPHVGFKAEDRIFIQVGSKDITFIQNGIQFGTVKNIPATSRDYLRGMTSITVVEVKVSGEKRLLRAKHTAMVSDISLGEGLRRPLQTFRRRSRNTGIQEI